MLLAVVALVARVDLLRVTRLGLELPAVGRNARSARVLGIPADRRLLGALLVDGALAGLAGAIQASGFHHKLVPSVSGGCGLLGILVVLLAVLRVACVAPIADFFAVDAVGSVALTLRLGVDFALGQVLMAAVVLVALLARGPRRRSRLRARTPPDPTRSSWPGACGPRRQDRRAGRALRPAPR